VNTTNQKYRTKIGIRLGVASIGVNLLLSGIKFMLGFLSGSIAIISDAIHTLSDVLTSLLVVFSFKISAKPSDPEHPFGHGRAEQITAIVMATLLGVAGFELLKSGFESLSNPTAIKAGWKTVLVIGLTIPIKSALAAVTKHYSKKINSHTLEADAWHHQTDAISTLLVIFALVLSYFNFYIFDGIVGVLIGLYIFYIAYEIAKKPADTILGGPTPGHISGEIKKISSGIGEILDVHDIIYHDYGSNQLVSLHIEVNKEMTLSHAHQVAEHMTRLIREKLNIYATIHVDPMSPKTRFHHQVEEKLKDFCMSHNLCGSFHEMRLEEKNQKFKLYFELQILKEMPEKEKRAIKQELRTLLKNEFKQLEQINIFIDPLFALET